MKKRVISFALMMSCLTTFAEHNDLKMHDHGVKPSHHATKAEHHDLTVARAAASDYTFDINYTTLFLKSSSNLEYAAQASDFVVGGDGSPQQFNVYSVQPHYNFAFDLGAKVVLHDKESVLKANWEHFVSSNSTKNNKNENTNIVRKNASDNILGSFTQFYNNAELAYNEASGVAAFRRDKLNISYGQSVEVGQSLSMNLFAGVSFNRLEQTLVNNFSEIGTENATQQSSTNTFSGVGPELGMDLNYNLHKGLGFVLRSQIGLITGTTKNNRQYVYNNLDLNTFYEVANGNPFIQNLVTNGQLTVVPTISQKIGVNYELLFRDHCAFQMEVGYFTQIYIDVFKTIALNPIESNNTSGIAPHSVSSKSTDFALSGPYFKLEVGF